MELSNRTLGDWLEHWAKTTPDKEYIVFIHYNNAVFFCQCGRPVLTIKVLKPRLQRDIIGYTNPAQYVNERGFICTMQ